MKVALFLALSVALAAPAGCLSWLAPDPPKERAASASVTSPDGQLTARAVVRFEKGWVGAHSSRSDTVTHVLVMERGGAQQEVLLGRYRPGDGAPGEYNAAGKAHLTLAFAPDGHALSVSSDSPAGGATQRHVVLDAGDPFPCGLEGAAGAAPPTRALVLDDLRASGLRGHAHGLRSCDVAGLSRVACKLRGDAELWDAVIGALLPAELVDQERYPLLACLREEARASPRARSLLITALGGKPPELELAAEALSKSADPAAQAALAAALRPLVDEKGKSTQRCWTLGKVSWSLASVTADRRVASAEARAVLADLARGDDPCPKELSGKAARIHALFALAALGETTLLGELAAPCAAPPEPWSLPFVQWNEALTANLERRPPACLAKGLLR